MHISFVGPVPPLTGGISQHSARLISALRDQGHEVDVISWRSQYPELLRKSPQRDRTGEVYPGTQYALSWWNPLSWLRARRRAARSDLLILPYVTPVLAVPQRAILGGCRHVAVVVHNALPHEPMPLQRLMARMVLRRAHLVVTHGLSVADDVRELKVSAPIEVVPMPPTLVVAPSPLPLRPPLKLLFLGFVRPYKGLHVAIESLALLTQGGVDAVFTILGSFWEPVEKYEQQVDRLGLTGRITIRNTYASDEEVLDAIASHHLLIVPYLEDTLSAVIPVALASGRPVVSTLVRGISEQVKDSVDGILVTPGNPGELTRGVIKAARRLEELARATTTTAPNWESVASIFTSS